MKQLNVRELTAQLATRQAKRHQCFDRILEMCFMVIKRHADKNALFCLYEVPEFVLGMPLYDLNECISYLVEKLKANGFLVKYYFPRVLYISWNVNEIKEDKLQRDLSLIETLNAPKPRQSRKQSALPSSTTVATTKTVSTSLPTKAGFIKSVKQFKPSGKIVLDV